MKRIFIIASVIFCICCVIYLGHNNRIAEKKRWAEEKADEKRFCDDFAFLRTNIYNDVMRALAIGLTNDVIILKKVRDYIAKDTSSKSEHRKFLEEELITELTYDIDLQKEYLSELQQNGPDVKSNCLPWLPIYPETQVGDAPE